MKHIISSLTLSALLFAGFAANADEVVRKTKTYSSTDSSAVRPYLGLDFGFLHTKHKTANSKTHTIIIPLIPNAGLRIGSYFGLEAGYMPGVSRTSKILPYTTFKQHTNALYLDARAYAPVTKSLEAVASIGTGYSRTKNTFHSTSPIQQTFVSTKAQRTLFRLGGGLQYNINDNISFRGLVHYNFNTPTKHNVWMPTVGINYTF